MVKRRIGESDGIAAISTWKRLGEDTDRQHLLTAVRWSLEELAALHPGGAVEIRVPPAGVTQAFSGTTHRRGTPPAVIETDPHTWLALVTGALTWDEAVRAGSVEASGQRTDLADYLPLTATASLAHM